jgi:hypothetical protein
MGKPHKYSSPVKQETKLTNRSSGLLPSVAAAELPRYPTLRAEDLANAWA